MKTRQCAVCGKDVASNKFGDGITCPETTCLNCKAEIAKFTEVLTKMFVKRIIKVVK